MKAFLIDSKNQEIKEVEHNSWRDIAPFLGCSMFTVGAYLPNGDCIYVDDEGLLCQPEHFFVVPTYPTPLAGNGLVVGSTPRSGDSIDAKSTIEELKKMVRFEDINTVGLKIQMGIYQ